MKEIENWTDFSPFPTSNKLGYLHAPFGAGVYELINNRTNELVYVGEGGNVAYRMSSLLPIPYGAGTRNNIKLRNYILNNLDNINYRTIACLDKATAKEIQDNMITKNKYLFN